MASLDRPQLYKVAWLAALPIARAAAEILLDEEHGKPKDFTQHAADTNSYTWGRMGKHNIVIVSLPCGEYGEVVTADMTAGLRASLPHIRVGLLVGIATGVTGERQESDGSISIDRDIRLGDIAVSNPDKFNAGVVQYDLFKTKGRIVQGLDGNSTSENFKQMKDFLNAPPLRSALAKLQARHEYQESRVEHHLKSFDKTKKTRTFRYPGRTNPSKGDEEDSSDSEGWKAEDPLRAAIVERKATLRLETKSKQLKSRSQPPAIHYGTIASGSILLKNRAVRDDLLSQLKQNNIEPICFEMEAAGVMSSFPSLLVRGICDYGDERKNDRWQKYAAATAAAFAKEFLEVLDPEEVEQELPIRRVEEQVEQLLEHFSDYRDQQFDKWLSPPDPTTNFNKAKEQRHSETGLWLLQSDQFNDWYERAYAVLWLHGLPGCGKTILSSTIIAHLQQRNADKVVLYFFFDFNDDKKQSFDKMLRSLAAQAYSQCKSCRQHLDQLHSVCPTHPNTWSLIMTLHTMIEELESCHIVLDALDECDSGSKEDMLDWLASLPRNNLHLVLTSRREHDIETALIKWIPTASIMPIQNDPVDRDIRTVIRSRLTEDEELQRWQSRKEVQQEIETRLMETADGMFRWAVCQLDALRDCLDLSELRNALKSLPQDLNETYGRILNNIRPAWIPRATRLLQFLTYSKRPLLLEEAVDAIAVNPDIDNCENSFREQDRMPNPSEIMKYCSPLVKITNRSEFNAHSGKVITVSELQLVHLSAKEYLTSEKVEASFKRALTRSCANAAIAEVCISYMVAGALNLRGLEVHSPSTGYDRLPFAEFSASFLAEHATELEASNEPAVARWFDIALRNASQNALSSALHPGKQRLSVALGPVQANSLYRASLDGGSMTVKTLLDQGADVNSSSNRDHCFALQAASHEGHKAVVQLLLERGADVNAHGGLHGSALVAASHEGHEEVVRKLLDNGAHVNARSPEGHGIALQAASYEGHRAVAQILINAGANVNARGGTFGYALQAASFRGRENIVRLLLKTGADVHARGGYYGHALQAASYSGHETTVKILLDAKADVNARGGRYGYALQAASYSGHASTVQTLLDAKADVNAVGGAYGHALLATSYHGHEATAYILLEYQAFVNHKGKDGSALHIASRYGHVSLVDLLLENMADVNLEGKDGSALQIASHYGHDKVVDLLLRGGADVNVSRGECGSALQIASHYGHDKVVELLLRGGAEVNVSRGEYGSAIEAASRRRFGKLPGFCGDYRRTAQLLLEKGATYRCVCDDCRGSDSGSFRYKNAERANHFMELGTSHRPHINQTAANQGQAYCSICGTTFFGSDIETHLQTSSCKDNYQSLLTGIDIRTSALLRPGSPSCSSDSVSSDRSLALSLSSVEWEEPRPEFLWPKGLGVLHSKESSSSTSRVVPDGSTPVACWNSGLATECPTLQQNTDDSQSQARDCVTSSAQGSSQNSRDQRRGSKRPIDDIEETSDARGPTSKRVRRSGKRKDEEPDWECVWFVANGRCDTGAFKKWPTLSEMHRHVRQAHKMFMCEECFTPFGADELRLEHKDHGADPCCKSCRDTCCQRRRPRSERHIAGCEHLYTQLSRWEAALEVTKITLQEISPGSQRGPSQLDPGRSREDIGNVTSQLSGNSRRVDSEAMTAPFLSQPDTNPVSRADDLQTRVARLERQRDHARYTRDDSSFRTESSQVGEQRLRVLLTSACKELVAAGSQALTQGHCFRMTMKVDAPDVLLEVDRIVQGQRDFADLPSTAAGSVPTGDMLSRPNPAGPSNFHELVNGSFGQISNSMMNIGFPWQPNTAVAQGHRAADLTKHLDQNSTPAQMGAQGFLTDLEATGFDQRFDQGFDQDPGAPLLPQTQSILSPGSDYHSMTSSRKK